MPDKVKIFFSLFPAVGIGFEFFSLGFLAFSGLSVSLSLTFFFLFFIFLVLVLEFCNGQV